MTGTDGEDFLRDVTRQLEISDHVAGDPEDALAPALHEKGEGLEVALGGPLHQIGVLHQRLIEVAAPGVGGTGISPRAILGVHQRSGGRGSWGRARLRRLRGDDRSPGHATRGPPVPRPPLLVATGTKHEVLRAGPMQRSPHALEPESRGGGPEGAPQGPRGVPRCSMWRAMPRPAERGPAARPSGPAAADSISGRLLAEVRELRARQGCVPAVAPEQANAGAAREDLPDPRHRKPEPARERASIGSCPGRSVNRARNPRRRRLRRVAPRRAPRSDVRRRVDRQDCLQDDRPRAARAAQAWQVGAPAHRTDRSWRWPRPVAAERPAERRARFRDPGAPAAPARGRRAEAPRRARPGRSGETGRRGPSRPVT